MNIVLRFHSTCKSPRAQKLLVSGSRRVNIELLGDLRRVDCLNSLTCCPHISNLARCYSCLSRSLQECVTAAHRRDCWTCLLYKGWAISTQPKLDKLVDDTSDRTGAVKTTRSAIKACTEMSVRYGSYIRVTYSYIKTRVQFHSFVGGGFFLSMCLTEIAEISRLDNGQQR